MKRTLENCSLIKKAVAQGIGEPEQRNERCLGYGGDTDEPFKICKECYLYEGYEEDEE